MKRNARRGREAEPTFCGDLDVETGDCGLMFLAEEPADKDETEIKKMGGVCSKQGRFQTRPAFFLPLDDTA